MFVETRVRSGANWANYSIIQRWRELSFDTKYLDAGALNIGLPNSDVAALGIQDLSVVEVCPDGQSMIDGWYYIDGTSGTQVADDETWTTFSGKSLIALLDEGIVYPSAWPSAIPAGHDFLNATAGTIVRTLVARCQQRGALTWLDVNSFTGTTTSNNTGWGATVSKNFDSGTGLFQVLMDLAAQGLIMWRMVGTQLQLFNQDVMNVHRSPDAVTVRRGQNVLDQAKNTSSTDWISHILVVGDQNQAVERNAPAQATLIGRRRELYLAQSGITDIPTLQMIGDKRLSMSHLNVEDTVTATDTTTPFLNWQAGDWIWADYQGTLSEYQVQQIAGSVQDDTGVLQVGLTLGDLIDAQNAKTQRLLDAITNGGGAIANPAGVDDGMPPSAPPGVSFTALAYRDANGRDFCACTVTWTPPSTNTDGTPLRDLGRYDVTWRTGTNPWGSASTIDSGVANTHISHIPCGVQVTFRVRAVDTFGNASGWTESTPQITPYYVTTPATPSTPTLAAGINSIVIIWDGLNATGGIYGNDFARCEFYVGTAANFTANDQSLVGSITSRGGRILVQLAQGSYYAKLVVVDKSNNRSLASAAGGPMATGGVPTQELADHSVTAAKIANAAITTSELSIGAFGDSVIPNGAMEDPAVATVDNTGAAHWQSGPQSSGTTYSRNTTTFIQGSASLQMTMNAGAATRGQITNSAAGGTQDPGIPTAAGDIWYVRFKAMASRDAVVPIVAQLALAYDKPHELTNDVNNPWIAFVGNPDATGNASDSDLTSALDDGTATGVAGSTGPLGATWMQYEGQMVVPGGYTYPLVLARLVLTAGPASDAAAVNVFIDDLVLLPVKGNAYIPNASISAAQIVALAADQITAGSLTVNDISASSLSGGVDISDATISASQIVIDDDGGTILVYSVQGGSVYTITTGTSWTNTLGFTGIAKVQCYAAGGGGTAGRSSNGGGQGGAGGEWARQMVSITNGAAYSIQIGAGGAPSAFVAGATQKASNGGNTFFVGDAGTGQGQGVTVTAHGGLGAWASTQRNGGSGSTNQLHKNGGNNNVANQGAARKGGNSGASSASWKAAGNTANATKGNTGANQRNAPTDGGFGGAGGNGGTTRTAGANGGVPGGGGGGGATNGTNTTNSAGGTGGRGAIVINYGETHYLIMSIAESAGTDDYGNSYPAGVRVHRQDLIGPVGWYARDATFTSASIASGTGWTYLGSTATIMQMDDGRNAFASGIFTAPEARFYHVSMFTGGTTGAGLNIQVSQDNGSTWTSRFVNPGATVPGTGGSATQVDCSGYLWMNQGDKLRFGVRQTSGANATVGGYICVVALP